MRYWQTYQGRVLISFAMLLFWGMGCKVQAENLYVATNGNDAWTGRIAAPNASRTDGPFATLERARDEIRRRKKTNPLKSPMTVQVRGGSYALRQPFALTAEDSGTKAAPITYRAYTKEVVNLVGGVEVTGFQKYKGDILQCSVKGLDLGKLASATTYRNTGDVPHFELFFGGKRMDLARWPNHRANDIRDGEWTYIAAVPQKGKTKFTYIGDRPARWSRPEEAQVHIWPWWDWYDQYVGVGSIDSQTRSITLSSPTQYDLQPGRRFYVRNVFEELDAPGEWYLDRRTDTLYFWPPRPITEEKVFVSVAENIVTLKEVEHVTLRGFTIEGCRGTAIVITDGADNRIAGCTIRNTGLAAINVSGGFRCGIIGNDIYDTGRTGISIGGGDRKTLTPGGHYAENNHVHHFGRVLKCYEPGIAVEGVGNRIAHNLIHDGPHAGMIHGGNDHIIEFNELHHVCLEGADNGAFYTGRDWTYRGNILRYNSFHDVYGYGFVRIDAAKGIAEYESPHTTQGIYLDDAVSSFHIYGNLLYRIGDRMIQLGGGRDHLIENNIFVDGRPAIGVDARWSAYNWDGHMFPRLNAVPYQTPPWSTRYPELVKPMRNYKWPEGNRFLRNISAATQPQPEGFLAFRYMLPADATEIDRNLVWNGGGPVLIDAHFLDKGAKGKLPWAKWQAEGFDKNGQIADPLFVDAANDNYQLRENSPAYRMGFQRIPLEKIGLYKDELRASWPVAKDIRRESPARRVEQFPLSAPPTTPSDKKENAVSPNAPTTVVPTASDDSPLNYTGSTAIDTLRHDGGLRPAIGVENIQVMRARRDGASSEPGIGWTYNHAPMLTYFKDCFYLHYLSDPVSEHAPPGCTLLVTSPDGHQWSTPRLLFPPYPNEKTPGGKGIVMHQRMGFYTAPSNRLLALGFYGENDGKGIGRVVREVYAPDRFGPVYFLRLNRHAGWDESKAAFPLYSTAPDKEFKAACESLLSDRLVRAQWWEEDRSPDGFFTVEGHKALSFFRRPDGNIVGIWKGGNAAITRDEGKTWSAVAPSPGIVTNGAKVWGQQTPDGNFALLYNPTTDNNHRWPLAVITGNDGVSFQNMLVVHGEVPPRRYYGRFKDLGPQYIRGIEPTGEGDRGKSRNTPPGQDIWVTYSVNKEDIWVSRVPTPIRYRVEKPVNDRFDAMKIGGIVPDWNLYGTTLASVGIAAPKNGKPCLTLTDADPYDYAHALRVFPESAKVEIRLRLQAQQADSGRLDIEVADYQGRRPVRLRLTEPGQIAVEEKEKALRPISAYQANRWYDIRLVIDTAAQKFSVELDGKTVASGVALVEEVTTVERLSLRTGAYRDTPDREAKIDSFQDVTNPDGPVRPARFDIASVQVTPLRNP